jgi:hypothetical protein
MKSVAGTDRESTVYDNGSIVYEPPSPEMSKVSFPEATRVSFTSTSDLDPAILDPEMSNYFLGTDHGHEPPPYSEVDAADFLDHSLLVDHEDGEWSSQFDHPYDSYIAQPLSSAAVIDPKLFSSQISSAPELPAIFSGSLTPTQSEQLSVGIAPILLSKTPSVEVAREIKVVEKPGTELVSGKEMGEIHVKQLERPPKRKPIPSDVSPKETPPTTAKRRARPPKSLAAQPHLTHLPPTREPLSERLTVRPRSEIDNISEITETANRRRYEVIVATGLDTVKRIKLIFHEDLTPPPLPVDPTEYPQRTTRSGKRDIILRPRRTPLLAVVDDALSNGSDDSMSPPAKRRKFISGVVVPCKRIDRNLYGVFVGSGEADDGYE